MSGFPFGRESKATNCPSGDHRGVPVSGPLKEVSRTAFSPETSATHISSSPVRSERNAMRLPSGEYCGLRSLRVEKRTRLASPVWRFVSQILLSERYFE